MTDLNEIVTTYKIHMEGTTYADGVDTANGELEVLQDMLSDVPVSINPTWDVSKCADQFISAGIEVLVELICPEGNFYLVNDCSDLNDDELESVTERLEDPYPFITISGEGAKTGFYKNKKHALSKVFQPSKFGARVLQTSARNSACIVWEKKDGKLGYIELFVSSKKHL